MAKKIKVPTPELDKLSAIQPESQAVSNFLEWLDAHDMFVAFWGNTTEAFPIRDSTEELMARYFEINLKKCENERRALIRAAKGE